MSAIDVAGHPQELRRLHRRRRRVVHRAAGRSVRPARSERRRQVDADPHADDAAAADERDGARRADSTSPSRPTASAASIGVIPQAMTSDTELSVEENLIIFSKLYGVPRARRKTADRRAARGCRPHRMAPQAGDVPFGRHAAPRRNRARPGARAEDLLPRRADDGPRSGLARRGVGNDQEDQGRARTSPFC